MNKSLFKTLIISIAICCLSITLLSEINQNADKGGFNWKVSSSNNKIQITAIIAKNYYLYKNYTNVKVALKNNKPLQHTTKPTAIRHKNEFGTVSYIFPPGKHIWIFNAKPGKYNVEIKYQGCSTVPFSCYPPKLITESITVKKSDISSIDNNLISNSRSSSETGSRANYSNNNSYIEYYVQKGGVWLFILAVLGGFFSVFTPCVLPLLPITIAILGAGKKVKFRQAVIRSFLYVSGIVITFTGLAILASASGKAFGTAFLSNPKVLIFFAVFFCIMSMSLLGFFDFKLPNSLNNTLNKLGGNSNAGAFIMGLTAGFIAIPCTGPILATLLGISAAAGNITFGSLLLFMYAVGFGIPFFIIGIGLSKAPKSGYYMEIIKSSIGIIILILAFYIICMALPQVNNFFTAPSAWHKYTALLLIIFGAILGAFHADGHSHKKYIKFVKFTAAVILAAGCIWIIKIPVGKVKEKIHWENTLNAPTISETNKPTILEFTADWCAACKEMEAKTFSNQDIINAINKNWTAIRIDATRTNDSINKILKNFNVQGLPTLILFSSKGVELKRFSGFISHKKLLPELNSAISSGNIQ